MTRDETRFLLRNALFGIGYAAFNLFFLSQFMPIGREAWLVALAASSTATLSLPVAVRHVIDSGSLYPRPIRLRLPAADQATLTGVLALRVRGGDGQWQVVFDGGGGNVPKPATQAEVEALAAARKACPYR